jgi:hypothetical protein
VCSLRLNALITLSYVAALSVEIWRGTLKKSVNSEL